MQVDISLGSFSIDDKMVDESSRFQQLVTSDVEHAGRHGTTDLVRIRYARVQPDSPEFMTVHEGNNQVSAAYIAFVHSDEVSLITCFCRASM